VTDEELIAGCDHNYFEAWRMLAGSLGDGVLEEEDGLLVAAPGGTIVWLNIVFVTRPLRDPDAQLARAFARLDERGMPFLVRIREGMSSCSFDVVAIHVDRHTSSPFAKEHTALGGWLTPNALKTWVIG